jgi:hypothetical protein
MPDAGSVQVRFTVANAEVVRQALAQLGKDGEAALKAFDSSAQSTASGGDQLAKALADVAAKAAASKGEIGGAVSQVINFAKGARDLAKTSGAIAVLAGGIGLAITLAGKLYEALNSGEQDATKDLEQHTRLLALMRKAYDDAGQSVGGFAKNLSAVVRFQAEMNLQRMTADLAALARATVRSQTYMPAAAQGTLDAPLPPGTPMAVPDVEAVRPEFAAFADAIKMFDAGGLDNIIAAREEVAKLGAAAKESNPELAKAAFTWLAGTEQAGKLADAIRKMSEALTGKFDGPASKGPDRHDSATQRVKDQIEELKLQEQTAGRSTEALVKLKTEHDLLRAAQRAGREVTTELRAEIEKLAAIYAELTERVARAKLTGDAFFEQAQFGRDEIEQRVAARLRGAGLDVDLASPLAGLLRLNEQLRITRDLLTSTTAGGVIEFKNAMMQGAEAGEAALKALYNQLNRVADKLISMAADGIWAAAFGGSGGINLFSLLGLGGGAGVGVAAPVGVVGAAGGMVVPTFMHQGGLVGRDGDRGGPLPASVFAGAPRLHGGGAIDWARGERPIIGLTGERMLNRREAADYERTMAMHGSAPAPARIGLDLKVSVDEGGNLVPLIQKIAGAEAEVRIEHHDRFKLPRLIQRHKRTSMLETGRG